MANEFNISYWNYRLMLAENGEWHLREVYYDADDNVVGWTANPAAPWGETADEIASVMRLMLEAFDRPPLTESELPGFQPNSEAASG
jgi:hypothetical protein